jgi:hypothetical protein
MRREDVPFAVSRLIDNRPVRWATRVLQGAYDGWNRTLQVFNANAKDQHGLHERIDRCRSLLETAAGGPLILICHSEHQSKEVDADFLEFWKPLEEDDVERDARLRALLLKRPIVYGTIHEGIDHPAYHVFLKDPDGDHRYSACAVFSDSEDERRTCPNFWSQPVQGKWPDLDVPAAVKRWCERCFPDVPMPTFELVPWTEDPGDEISHGGGSK